MEFRTKVEIPSSDLQITHRSRLSMMGSCFIENIGRKLIDNKFNIDLNPFGVLYNPLSISQGIRLLMDNRQFDADDVFEDKGLFNSFYFHSSFSHHDRAIYLDCINKRLSESRLALQQANVLLITFGTAYVFRSLKKDMIVGNCHKLPASQFNRYLLSVDEIFEEWVKIIKELRQFNPSLKILFTVSPIRHMKDGALDNQVSKSTLLLALNKICKAATELYYFPSYEIMMDELRDYRFYAGDMIHPNEVAIRYIWERFCDTHIASESYPVMEEWNKIYLAIHHKPFNPQGGEYKHFLRQTLLKLKAFQDKYPYICLTNEITDIETRLNV